MFLLDFLFPKKCVGCGKIGDFLCSSCFSGIEYTNSFLCPECLRPSFSGLTHTSCHKKNSLDGVFPVVVYKGVVKKLLYQFKYGSYLSSLSEILVKIMYEGLLQNESFYKCLSRNTIFVSVPLSSKRKRQRGYNHAELLSKKIAVSFGLISLNLLNQINDSENTIFMSHNIKINLKNKTIILIDDTAKTYRVLKECAEALKHAGVKKVYATIFAGKI